MPASFPKKAPHWKKYTQQIVYTVSPIFQFFPEFRNKIYKYFSEYFTFLSARFTVKKECFLKSFKNIFMCFYFKNDFFCFSLVMKVSHFKRGRMVFSWTAKYTHHDNFVVDCHVRFYWKFWFYADRANVWKRIIFFYLDARRIKNMSLTPNHQLVLMTLFPKQKYI